jgi:hypothetical protein
LVTMAPAALVLVAVVVIGFSQVVGGVFPT